jgi:hypothetical protein
MYVLLLLALLAAGVVLARAGVARSRPALVWAGALVGAATLALFSGMSLWADALWFHALGYGPRFWTFLSCQAR